MPAANQQYLGHEFRIGLDNEPELVVDPETRALMYQLCWASMTGNQMILKSRGLL